MAQWKHLEFIQVELLSDQKKIIVFFQLKYFLMKISFLKYVFEQRATNLELSSCSMWAFLKTHSSLLQMSFCYVTVLWHVKQACVLVKFTSCKLWRAKINKQKLIHISERQQLWLLTGHFVTWSKVTLN